MRKKIIVLFSCTILLAGCYDQNEIEQQAYVMAIGLDKADGVGKVKVTFLIANPEVGTAAGGGSPDEPPSEIVSFVAPDFSTARDTANAFVAKRLRFSHAQTLIVSEELARSTIFLQHMYGTIRDREVRREMNIVVSRENASDFLRDNNPLLESRAHKYYQFMINRSIETGLAPAADIHRFMQITEADGDLYLAIYATTKQEGSVDVNEDEFYAGQIEKEGGNPTQVVGSAVFKEGKMIGVLTGEETRLSLLLDNSSQAESMLVTYQDPLNEEYRIGARVLKKESTKIVMDLQKEQPSVTATVPLSLELTAIPSLENYITDFKKQALLERFIEEDLGKKAQKFIAKTQEEFKGEPFYWSLVARKQFLTNKAYTEYDWKKAYPNLDINVNFEIEITEFGQQVETPELPKVRD